MIPSDVTLLDWETIEQPGDPEYHDALTIQLMQLVEDGIVTYDSFPMPGLDEEIRQRLWEKFQLRFNWREIGILPIRRWLERLQARCREAAAAYKPLYDAAADGANVMREGDEWHKSRDVFSTFPQTALGGSDQDYASSGTDREYETIRDRGMLEVMAVPEQIRDIDAMVLDTMEPLFMAIISTSISWM